VNQAWTYRVVGAVALLVGGVVSAVVAVVEFFLLSRSGPDLADSGSAVALASLFGFIASLFFLVGFVSLALSRGSSGISDASRLPVTGFIVLTGMFVIAQLSSLFIPLAFAMIDSTLIAQSLTVVNCLLIAAIAFAAVAVLVRGALAGPARFALFLPAVVLLLSQLPLPFPYPGFLLTQAVYGLTWAVVAVLYLRRRPRAAEVTAASESLAE